MEWNFELVAGPYGGTTEGPAWDGSGLLFSFTHGNVVLRYDPATGQTTEFRKHTNRTNGLAFSAQGELYACQQMSRRIVRFNHDGSTTPMEYLLDGKYHNNPNDLAIDKQGRIWFSDPIHRLSLMSSPQPHFDHQSVLRLEQRADRAWVLRRMTSDTNSPNGLLVSEDQQTLYVADSSPVTRLAELRAYSIRDDGNLGSYTVLHTWGHDHRGPHRGIDGMCLDEEGNIIACAGAHGRGVGPMLYVFSPTGRVLSTHPTPVDDPTNCTFGGPNLEDLYVTSMGGHLFRVSNTGHRGWLIYPRRR